ncbi:MAG TPA: response regulator transcription factor [Methylophilaceae bacterium]|nr:response regulator transcription factor [Methylophilaceae bacterium]
MRDIFLCPNGKMLDNWRQAFPKALVSASLVTVPVEEPVVFWVHANTNDLDWLESVMNGIDKKFKASKIVVLANTPNQSDALIVMRRGAVGYCHAYSESSTLKELKTVVMHGGIWLGNDLLQTLICAIKEVVRSSSSNVEKALDLLTGREQEVALEAAKGFSNKEIARLLNITERTVKAHISSSLEKLGVKDRLQLALVLNGKNELATKKFHTNLKMQQPSQGTLLQSQKNNIEKKLEYVVKPQQI